MRIVIDQLETHYQRIGTGSPVVLLHGWGCDWQIWSPVITQLSAQYQLLIPDLPAFGSSAAGPTVWSSTEYVTWLEHFIAATCQSQPLAVVGHSFGGKIAALWAATKQSSPQPPKLILVDASGLPDPVPPARQLQKKLLGIVPSQLKELLPRRWKQQLLTATGSATDFFNANPQQRAIFSAIINEQIGTKLPLITSPTLVIWGLNDLDTPLHQGKAFANLIPTAELSIFTKSGHFPFVDETHHFIEKITYFLEHTV